MELRSTPEGNLELDEVREHADDIRKEFDRLLASPLVAPRPKALQWRFFRRCFDSLMSGEAADFPYERAKVTQYRFEVEERLSRYYARKGDPVRYMFSVQHGTRAMRAGTVDDDYPTTNGYVLLVFDVRAAHLRTPERETRFLLERIVADAIDAEFKVYRSLPKIDLSPLDGVFVMTGPAYKRIQALAHRLNHRRWTIANHRNPSTRRLIAIKSVKLQGDEAHVRTEEYWYLRWWSIKKKKDVVIYTERNFHTYILVRDGDRWLVQHDMYPPPRASAARRKWY